MGDGNLFYYVTYKYVLLKDARLGVLYYVLALLTVLYTVVEIFIRKGYMEVNLTRHYKHGCSKFAVKVIPLVGKGSTVDDPLPLHHRDRPYFRT